MHRTTAVGTTLVMQVGDAGLAARTGIPDHVAAGPPASRAEGLVGTFEAFAAFQADEMRPVRTREQLVPVENVRIRQPTVLVKDSGAEKRVANPRLPVVAMAQIPQIHNALP